MRLKSPRPPKIYATLRQTFTYEQLKRMGFTRTANGQLARLGAMRRVRAIASTGDNVHWRVTPMERHWR